MNHNRSGLVDKTRPGPRQPVREPKAIAQVRINDELSCPVDISPFVSDSYSSQSLSELTRHIELRVNDIVAALIDKSILISQFY